MNEKTQTHSNNSDPAASGANGHAMDRVAKSVHDGIDAASNAAHPTIDRAAAGAHKAVGSADDMANRATDAIEKAGVKGEEFMAASTSYMHKHPLLTLGIAVTAGYALSRLLASR